MKHLILDTNGLVLKKRDGCFLINSKKEKNRKVSPHVIKSIIVLADVYLSTACILLANHNEIPIYYGDRYGNVHATLRSKSYKGRTDVRMKQAIWCRSDEALEWAVTMINQKIEGKNHLLKKFNKKNPFTKIALTEKIVDIRSTEAIMAKQYWAVYRTLLPAGWIMKSRNIRPAEDHVNAWLNYFYGFMYTLVEQAIWANGLDPYFYVMHSNHYQKPALVYDLIEPFRPFVDEFVIHQIRSGEIDMNMIHVTDGGKMRISRIAKKKVIPLYLAYLKQRVTIDGYSTSIYKHVYRAAYHLRQLIQKAEI